MGKYDKLYLDIRTGQNIKNVNFEELRNLIIKLGGNERVKGDHFIYTFEGITEIINIQPVGNKAKPYQVRQIKAIIERYGFKIEE